MSQEMGQFRGGAPRDDSKRYHGKSYRKHGDAFCLRERYFFISSIKFAVCGGLEEIAFQQKGARMWGFFRAALGALVFTFSLNTFAVPTQNVLLKPKEIKVKNGMIEAQVELPCANNDVVETSKVTLSSDSTGDREVAVGVVVSLAYCDPSDEWKTFTVDTRGEDVSDYLVGSVLVKMDAISPAKSVIEQLSRMYK